MMSDLRSETKRGADSPVEDVRQVRERLSEQFGNDVRKLGEHVRRVSEEARRELGCELVHKTRVPASSSAEA
jgi:hypothetical protein